MKIAYKDKKTQRLCTDFNYAKKELNVKIAEKLHALISMLQHAENLYDLSKLSVYRLHSLQGNMNRKFALDIAGRKSGYRLIIIPLDSDGKEWNLNDKNCIYRLTQVVLIWEVSNHYE